MHVLVLIDTVDNMHGDEIKFAVSDIEITQLL